jgi:hypothetical protein
MRFQGPDGSDTWLGDTRQTTMMFVILRPLHCAGCDERWDRKHSGYVLAKAN